jgi:hypothetical protein
MPIGIYKRVKPIWNKGKHIQSNDALKVWRDNGGVPWNKGKKGLQVKSEEYKKMMSERMSGENNPMHGVHFQHTEETRKKMSDSHKGKTPTHIFPSGPEHYNWNGGISYKDYPIEFSRILKRKIRKRDNYSCQMCQVTERMSGYRMSIHHIDYDKKNNEDNNLICLCKICHSYTNFNREDWTKKFKDKMPINKSLKAGLIKQYGAKKAEKVYFGLESKGSKTFKKGLATAKKERHTQAHYKSKKK